MGTVDRILVIMQAVPYRWSQFHKFYYSQNCIIYLRTTNNFSSHPSDRYDLVLHCRLKKKLKRFAEWSPFSLDSGIYRVVIFDSTFWNTVTTYSEQYFDKTVNKCHQLILNVTSCILMHFLCDYSWNSTQLWCSTVLYNLNGSWNMSSQSTKITTFHFFVVDPHSTAYILQIPKNRMKYGRAL